MRRWNLATKIIAGLSLAVLIGIVLFTPHQTFAAATSTTSYDPVAAAGKYDVNVQYGDCAGISELPLCIEVALKRFTLWFLIIIGRFFALLLNIGAVATRIMIEKGLDIINLPLVTAGFKLTQGITNLIFVLAIIIMAFATIFQIEDYSAKRLLKNLIIGAVLVNFSFLIAGIFIDTSNVFTNYFLKDVTPQNLGNAFNPQSLLSPATPDSFGIVSKRANKWYYCSPEGPKRLTQNPNGDCGNLPYRELTKQEYNNEGLPQPSTEVNSGIETIGRNPDGTMSYKFNVNAGEDGWVVWFKVLQAIIFANVMTALLAIIMLALAIMVLVRNIWIAALLIFMPLIWGFHVIPKLSEHWDSWWKNFVKWIVYLPTVTFIVFLGITTTRVTAVSGGLFGSDVMGNIIQMLILCGIFVMALKVGKAGGMMGAALAFGVGGFIARSALGATKSVTSRSLQVTGGAINKTIGAGKYNPLKFVGRGISKTGKGIGAVGNKFIATGKIGSMDANVIPKFLAEEPGKTTLSWMKGDRNPEKVRTDANKYRSEHLKDMDADAIVKEVGHPHGGDGQAERIAMLQQLIDKKALGSKDISLDRIAQLLSAAKKAGMNELYNSASRDVLASRIHEVNPGNKDSEVSEVIELLRTGKNDKRSSVEIVNAFINDLGADQLAKVKLSKISDNGVKETIASKFAQSRATISKYLGNAAEDDIAALESEFKKSVDSATLTKGGASIKFDALILEKAPDAKKIFDDALTAAGTDDAKKKVVNQAQRSYEAYRRMNQTVGTP